MDYVKRLKEEVVKGFTKSHLESLIGLPKNTLASYLSGVKKMTPANEALTIKFLTENPELDILSMPKRTRVIKSDKTKKEGKKDFPPPPKQEKSETPPKNPPINQSKYDFLNS